MVETVRHPAIQTFLEWAREAIGRDPSFRVKVDAALAELTISPALRYHLEAELDLTSRPGAGRARRRLPHSKLWLCFILLDLRPPEENPCLARHAPSPAPPWPPSC